MDRGTQSQWKKHVPMVGSDFLFSAVNLYCHYIPLFKLYWYIIYNTKSVFLIEYGIWNSTGEIVYLPNPTKAVVLEENMITEQEKTIHSEFFDGRPGLKTEDRYLRIRSHILRVWYVALISSNTAVRISRPENISTIAFVP